MVSSSSCFQVESTRSLVLEIECQNFWTGASCLSFSPEFERISAHVVKESSEGERARDFWCVNEGYVYSSPFS